MRWEKALIVAVAILLSPAPVRSGEKPLAYVYAGPSACAGCPEALMRSLRAAGYRTEKIVPGKITRARLARARIFAIPGGDEESEVMDALSKREEEAIRDFVSGGGRFIGVCLGAYAASTRLYNPATRAGLDLIPSSVVLHGDPGTLRPPSGADPVCVPPSASSAVIPAGTADFVKAVPGKPRMELVDWKGKKRWLYFQDGPEIRVLGGYAHEVWGTYADGKVAAVQARRDKGKVGLIGPHLEADRSWLDDDNAKFGGTPGFETLVDPDGEDQDLFVEFVRALERD